MASDIQQTAEYKMTQLKLNFASQTLQEKWGFLLLAAHHVTMKRNISTPQLQADAAQNCIVMCSSSPISICCKETALESWINFDSITVGNVTAPNIIPDEAPGFEEGWRIVDADLDDEGEEGKERK